MNTNSQNLMPSILYGQLLNGNARYYQLEENQGLLRKGLLGKVIPALDNRGYVKRNEKEFCNDIPETSRVVLFQARTTSGVLEEMKELKGPKKELLGFVQIAPHNFPQGYFSSPNAKFDFMAYYQ